MSALLTREGPRLVSLATTDAMADVMAPGYFARWAGMVGVGDTVNVGRFENGALRQRGEAMVVEVKADRTVDVFQVRDAIDVPAPPLAPDDATHHRAPRPGAA